MEWYGSGGGNAEWCFLPWLEMNISVNTSGNRLMRALLMSSKLVFFAALMGNDLGMIPKRLRSLKPISKSSAVVGITVAVVLIDEVGVDRVILA